MAQIVLLGAGFSRNWGGLLADEIFEHLLAIPEIQGDTYLRRKLWHASTRGGFEYALGEVQSDCTREPEKEGSLRALQGGLTGIFESMNEAYSGNSPTFPDSLVKYLARFDAIYSLNQDTLLEQRYLPHVYLANSDRWDGPTIMGVRRTNRTHGGPESWADEIWVPDDGLKLDSRCQPLYKLHGSSNWRDSEGGQLLVLGGHKGRAIASQAALARCFERFAAHLSEVGSRLLVIGYSFRDDHINEVVIKAVNESDLTFFVIDPAGSEVARRANLTYGAQLCAPGELDHAFERGLVGASRRDLMQSFGGDRASYEKIVGFLGA